MTKNPWMMFIAGLMVGLVVGYVFAERQSIPPTMSLAPPGAASSAPGSQPAMMQNPATLGASEVESNLAEIRNLLAQNPGDARLLVAMGNIYFDAQRWEEARLSYEEAVETIPDDVNVLTDLAVVYRNIGNPDRALEILGEVIEMAPEHWQAIYNRVIVLHFDLHHHDDAVQALEVLEGMAENNPQVPDLSGLAAQVRHQ